MLTVLTGEASGVSYDPGESNTGALTRLARHNDSILFHSPNIEIFRFLVVRVSSGVARLVKETVASRWPWGSSSREMRTARSWAAFASAFGGSTETSPSRHFCKEGTSPGSRPAASVNRIQVLFVS